MIPEIQKICFIGAGTQGCLNALICSVYGYQSTIYDISEETLKLVPMRQQAIGATMIKQGYVEKTAFDRAISRIDTTADLGQAVSGADLVSESVNEKLALKRKVHAELDEVCPAETILTSNTSSLLVSELESAVNRGDRFAALHFNGTFPFIDLVGGSLTSEAILQTLARFIRSLEMRPMRLLKEKDGYLGNSLFISFLTTALQLVIDGHAGLEDVDRTWMMIQGSVSGPFGQMDIVGLDVVLDIIEEQTRRSRISEGQFEAISAFLKPFIESSNLGVKTGSGFYQYPRPVYRNPGFLKDES